MISSLINFFEFVTVTLNLNGYCEMLGNFLRLKMDEYESAGFWFQQDRATARYSRAILQEMILCRLISLRGDVAWPSRSPDLSPCNFFFLCRICRNCTRYSGESNGKLQRTTPYMHRSSRPSHVLHSSCSLF